MNKRLDLPHPYRLAHIHWIYEDEREGRGEWELAELSELPPELAADVADAIYEIQCAFGYERAPKLWRRIA